MPPQNLPNTHAQKKKNFQIHPFPDPLPPWPSSFTYNFSSVYGASSNPSQLSHPTLHGFSSSFQASRILLVPFGLPLQPFQSRLRRFQSTGRPKIFQSTIFDTLRYDFFSQTVLSVQAFQMQCLNAFQVVTKTFYNTVELSIWL